MFKAGLQKSGGRLRLSPLSNVTVTATISQSLGCSLTVMSFAGVDITGTNGSGAIGATGTANSARGAPSASLTTTRNGSWVMGVGNDFDNAISRTPGPNQTVVHQDLTSGGRHLLGSDTKRSDCSSAAQR